MVGKPQDALSPEQKAELGNLSSRQSQVGKGLQNLQERMDEMAGRMDESGSAGLGGHARGGPEERAARDGRQAGRRRRSTGKEPDGASPPAAGAGAGRAQRPGRRDPEPPRARACAAGERAQERRERAGQDAGPAGPEPEKDAGSAAEPECQGAQGAAQAAGQRAGRDPQGPGPAAPEAGQAERRAGCPGRRKRPGPDGAGARQSR